MSPAPPSTALSVTPPKGCSPAVGSCLGTLFFSIFLVAGATMLYYFTIRPLAEIQAAKAWVATPCVIQRSEVKVHDGDDGDTYSVDVAYTYTFKDQNFTSEKYAFFSMSSNSRKWRNEVVKAIPVGTETVCFIDPQQPQNAVLNRGLTPDWPWMLFPLPFALVGFIGISTVTWRWVTGKAAAPTPVGVNASQSWSVNESAQRGTGARISSWSESEFDDDDITEPPGPVTLQSEQSPLTAALFLFLFAAFWNGIVAVFVVPRIGEVLNGNWQWVDLFMVPFVLVGLGGILGAMHQLLASFNPVPLLTLSRQWIPLGAAAELTWLFRGNPRSIRKLTVTLEGKEEATYRRGTNTHTDTSVFYSEVLLETSDPFEIAQGAPLSIQIPNDTMHSFAGTNNKVTWRLTFHGDIPFWPNVHSAFPLRVMPHE